MAIKSSGCMGTKNDTADADIQPSDCRLLKECQTVTATTISDITDKPNLQTRQSGEIRRGSIIVLFCCLNYCR